MHFALLNWIKLFVLLLLPFSSIAQASKAKAGSYEAIQDSITTYKSVDISKAKNWVEKYFDKARKENNLSEECNAWENAISLSYLEKDFSKATDQVNKYLLRVKPVGDKKLIAKAYLMRGKSKMVGNDLTEALTDFYTALDISKKIKGSEIKEYALSTISTILQITGDHRKALNIRFEMLNYFDTKKTDSLYTKAIKSSRLISIYAAIADSYRKMNHIDSAGIYESKMQKYLPIADNCTKSIFYLSSAESAYADKKYSEAKALFKKAHTMCPSEHPLTRLNYDYQLGKSELGLKNYARAIEILQGGLDSYKVLPEEEGYMDDYYKLLANAYKETKQIEKANFYFEKYILSSAEFSKMKSSASQAFREKEMKEFLFELKKLENEKKSKNLAMNLVILVSSVSILILLFILLRFYRIRKRNEVRFEELIQKLNAHENTIINSKDSELEESTGADLSEDITLQILNGLKTLEEKHYFLNQDCNSYNVAKKIKTNTSYLSKVVNQEFEKNFNTYINDLRINYAIVKLKEDKQFRSYSIQSIAEELGYKSADSFTKYFKIHTGLNPSFYIKQVNSIS